MDRYMWNYQSEAITCQAGTIREYIFQNLPDHIFSFPIIVNAESSIIGCAIYMNTLITGSIF